MGVTYFVTLIRHPVVTFGLSGPRKLLIIKLSRDNIMRVNINHKKTGHISHHNHHIHNHNHNNIATRQRKSARVFGVDVQRMHKSQSTYSLHTVYITVYISVYVRN